MESPSNDKFNKIHYPQLYNSDFKQYSELYSDQSVIIYFKYGKADNDAFYDLSLKLCKLIEEAKLGIYDGHEIALGNSEGSFYIYGSSAEAIFKYIKPTLESVDFMKGAIANLRFGPIGKEAPEIQIEI